MRKAILIALSLALLASCSATRREPDENMRWLDVYYADGGDKLISSEQIAISTEENITGLITNSLQLMKQEPVDKDLKPVLPSNCEVLSVKFDHGVARINLSKEYLELQGFDKTIAEYAILMTLSNFWNVRSVEISVEGQVVTPEFCERDIVTEIPKGQG